MNKEDKEKLIEMNEIEKLQDDFKTFVFMGKYHNEPLIENENSLQCALITINKVL